MASGFRGGASFGLFVQNIKKDAVAQLTADQRQSLQSLLAAKPTGPVTPLAATPRPLVKEWKLGELLPVLQNKLKGISRRYRSKSAWSSFKARFLRRRH